MTKTPEQADYDFFFALGTALGERDREGGRLTTEQRIDRLCRAITSLFSELPQPVRAALTAYAQNRLNMIELMKQMQEAGLVSPSSPPVTDLPANVTPFPGAKPTGGPDAKA